MTRTAPKLYTERRNILSLSGLNYKKEDLIMRKALLLFLTAGLVFGFSACVQPEQRPYYSDNYGPYDRADRYDVGTRIDNQQRRIDQGIASGELTRREADVLIDNLNWIRDEYARAKRDGRLSQAEIERLSEHLNQNNRMITDKKNNDIRRVYTPMPMPAPTPVPVPRHEPQRNDFRDRIENQQKRIDQGIAKGDLTRREADMLQDNLNHIRDEYGRMKADGRLTPSEADRLDRDLDLNSRMIQDRRNNEIRRLYQPMPMPAQAPAPHRDHEKPTGFEARIHQQQKRIDDGVRTGDLTRKEAEIVQENLDKIRTVYSRMKSDGRLTEKEQDKLDKKLDRNDKMIYNKKHNAIERFD